MTHVTSPLEIFPASALDDVETLRPVLEDGIRNPVTNEVITEEIGEVLAEVERMRSGETDRYFAIARSSGGNVLGMMGLQTPGEAMSGFVTTENPQEIINAYVSKSSRGQGVGRALVGHLQDKALSDGRTELVLNSGPRYMQSGWPFWRSVYGEPVGKLPDYYGPRYDAMVWRKPLSDTE